MFPQVKQRCEVLEEQLVDLVVMAMERSENDDASNDECLSQLLWQHLSSQVIYFVLFQFASFPHMVMSLYEKVSMDKYSLPLKYIVQNAKDYSLNFSIFLLILNGNAVNGFVFL